MTESKALFVSPNSLQGWCTTTWACITAYWSQYKITTTFLTVREWNNNWWQKTCDRSIQCFYKWECFGVECWASLCPRLPSAIRNSQFRATQSQTKSGLSLPRLSILGFKEPLSAKGPHIWSKTITFTHTVLCLSYPSLIINLKPLISLIPPALSYYSFYFSIISVYLEDGGAGMM